MILIVADANDTPAQWLRSHWAGYDARLLTPADLSQPGWSFRPCSSSDWTGTAAGLPFDSNTPITGILNCLGQVTDEQLPHIVPEDRSYVASEMTAFLLSWQSELNCPILNRPQPNCLVGPSLSVEEWLLIAARLGQPVRTITTASDRRPSSTAHNPYRDALTVTIIGEQALGGDTELRTRALSIARSAGVELAAFCFSSGSRRTFLGANLRPDFANPDFAAAILEYFLQPHALPGPRYFQRPIEALEARPC